MSGVRTHNPNACRAGVSRVLASAVALVLFLTLHDISTVKKTNHETNKIKIRSR